MAEAGKDRAFWKEHWLAILALLVALCGGVPGGLKIYEHYTSPGLTDVQVKFDKDQSLCAFMNSDDIHSNTKLTVLLFKITITGKGQVSIYPSTFTLYLKCRGVWLSGRNFHPMSYLARDGSGANVVRCYRIISDDPVGRPKVEWFNIKGWTDVGTPDPKIEYGQPLRFSCAAIFDLSYADYQFCDGLRIELRDYLGHTFEQEVGVEFFNPMFRFLELCQKANNDCQGDPDIEVEQMRKDPSAFGKYKPH